MNDVKRVLINVNLRKDCRVLVVFVFVQRHTIHGIQAAQHVCQQRRIFILFFLFVGTLLSYNQVCSTSSQCSLSLGLSCSSNLCRCAIYYQWNSSLNTCKSNHSSKKNKESFCLGTTSSNNTLTYGNTCATGSAQCKSSLGLTCPTGNCSCLNNKIWNNTNCVCPSGTFVNASNLCGMRHCND